ncbi:MmcQ/YjbR family DNA-binding protein [Enterobacillus tribolii]|uniref:Putative DNA-binding protein (MmcQ/YjbR family) n=1 Tax=Enterobacillus tribolii TaxID=1487935 RepID=A0A370QGM8_9GAMM|nr:MmcQ/YjbR family DNA-binding protein [Enterobacillus tribolii]MBW7981837.1 MmcQ/YjbR family DNA-binding protein [Enterobacillus tribolii]RDK87518.1 putative DNA-binding protein (MmcQ/YjbR family) [Enterobacillus tribolii]
MNHSAFLQYCMAKPGAEQSQKNRWNANQVKVGGVMFAMVDPSEGRLAVSVKTSCEQARRLRNEYREIVPSQNLNKAHWSTLYLDGSLNDSLVYKLVDGSYQLALGRLPENSLQEL